MAHGFLLIAMFYTIKIIVQMLNFYVNAHRVTVHESEGMLPSECSITLVCIFYILTIFTWGHKEFMFY